MRSTKKKKIQNTKQRQLKNPRMIVSSIYYFKCYLDVFFHYVIFISFMIAIICVCMLLWCYYSVCSTIMILVERALYHHVTCVACILRLPAYSQICESFRVTQKTLRGGGLTHLSKTFVCIFKK